MASQGTHGAWTSKKNQLLAKLMTYGETSKKQCFKLQVSSCKKSDGFWYELLVGVAHLQNISQE